MTDQPVEISLTKHEALVLFEFLARFDHEETLSIEDPAEEYALWRLEGALESLLVEPFKPDYKELLAESRKAVRDKWGGESC